MYDGDDLGGSYSSDDDDIFFLVKITFFLPLTCQHRVRKYVFNIQYSSKYTMQKFITVDIFFLRRY